MRLRFIKYKRCVKQLHVRNTYSTTVKQLKTVACNYKTFLSNDVLILTVCCVCWWSIHMASDVQHNNWLRKKKRSEAKF